jgi:hypothetical protein
MNALDDFEAEYERWSTHTEDGVLTAVPPMPQLTHAQYDEAFAQWAAQTVEPPGQHPHGWLVAPPSWMRAGWRPDDPPPVVEPEPEIAVELWTDECGAHIGIDTGTGWKPYATMEVDGPMAQVIKLLVADPNEAP